MLFNSFSFMLFFPIVAGLYFLIPHKFRYLWLLLASYYFYMCWNPKYALLIATSTLITYASGILIARAVKKGSVIKKRLWVAVSFISNLSILFFFKYFDFAIANLNIVFNKLGVSLIQPTFDVVLPVGISFYTFQALSYTMDVYRGEIYVERNLLKYALFVSFFPQLVAGPIERSKNLLVQINERHFFDYERVKSGLLLMLWGLFLKLVIADRVAILVNQVYGQYTYYLGLQVVVATLFFGIQIYCDFNSYSLIAKGAAEVMGFQLMDNFKQPYFSRSIKEFWQRWHISLSTWFRDYLYIPIGGNKKGTFRKYVNIMIVFLVSGLWHGANWTFVMWGFLHGAFQIIGQMLRPLKNTITDLLGINHKNFSYKLGQGILTFFLVNFAWIFFRAPCLDDAFGVIHQIFLKWNPIVFVDGTLWQLGLNQKNFVLALGAIFIMVLMSIAEYHGIDWRKKVLEQGFLFRWSVYLLLIFSIVIFGVYGPGYSESQFLYFQF
ncbi:MAG: MBOAT family O-acyltransferase [Anaerovorax sp.]|nr:MBOAT family O-acyltransferase [Anaerovorax sp.]